MQFLTWACLFSAIIAMCFFDDKNEVTRIERRLTFLGLLMRTLSLVLVPRVEAKY